MSHQVCLTNFLSVWIVDVLMDVFLVFSGHSSTNRKGKHNH